MRSELCAAMLALAAFAPAGAQAPTHRPLRPTDLYQLVAVGDPQRSPDGQWVAYTVSTVDSAGDKNHSDIRMTSWDGTQTLPLTSGSASTSRPRFSPDGRYLGFLSSREDSNETTQLWLLNRQGGEGVRVTSLVGSVEDFVWSPDGKRIALVVEDDSTPADTAKHGKNKKPKPIFIDRFHFKEDVTGYLGKKRSHLYVFDVATHQSQILTPDQYDEEMPAWSPNGARLAFVSKRSPADVDRADNWDVFVMDARPGAPAVQLTTSPGRDNPPGGSRLAWSPDGTLIAYVRGSPDPKLFAYDENELAVVPAAGGEPRALATALDRPVADPQWASDGKTITVLVEDDRSRYPARVNVASGAVTRLLPGEMVVSGASLGHDGALTALVTTDAQPAEVVALENGALRRLTHLNNAWLANIDLGMTEDFASRSKDGTDVHGLIRKPVGYVDGHRYPTLLRIHGGPNGQDEHGFNFESALFAANGYAVVEVNYRGSSGRGAAFQRAILADWGHKEVIDLLGAMDRVLAMGLADSARLGIGGWSYGGILTDYTIATDHRFKAATSGAGSALQLAMYGVDEYITQYVAELGEPWEHPDLWIKVSYPFFHADRINTPTLFLGGDQDFNVPLIGGEQMYQALRALNVPSALVIYPGQFHGISRPSFKVDRLQRYLDWYAKYLKPSATTVSASARGN